MSLRSFFPLALLLGSLFASAPAAVGQAKEERPAPARKPRVECEHGPARQRLREWIRCLPRERMERRLERRERLGPGDHARLGGKHREHLRKRIVKRLERRHPALGEGLRKELRRRLDQDRERIDRLRQPLRRRRTV